MRDLPSPTLVEAYVRLSSEGENCGKASSALVHRDGGEPGFEVGVPAEGGQGAAGGEEGFLRGVFRFGRGVTGFGTAILENGEREAVDVRVMFTNQGFEGVILWEGDHA